MNWRKQVIKLQDGREVELIPVFRANVERALEEQAIPLLLGVATGLLFLYLLPI